MNPERILQLADDVKVAHDGERAARRKIAKLDAKLATGKHDHLRPLRSKIAAAAGAER